MACRPRGTWGTWLHVATCVTTRVWQPPVHGDVDEVEDGNVGEEEIEIRPPGAEEGAGYQPAHVQSVTNIDMTYNDWKQIKHVYVLLVSGHSDGGDGHGDGGHQRVRRGQRHHVHVVAGVEPRRAGVAHLAAQ